MNCVQSLRYLRNIQIFSLKVETVQFIKDYTHYYENVGPAMAANTGLSDTDIWVLRSFPMLCTNDWGELSQLICVFKFHRFTNLQFNIRGK